MVSQKAPTVVCVCVVCAKKAKDLHGKFFAGRFSTFPSTKRTKFEMYLSN
jgi:hypothetical protein